MTEPNERIRRPMGPPAEERTVEPQPTVTAPRATPAYASARAALPDRGAINLRRDLVRWGPIVAGLVTALTTLILLSLLAVALGITAADTGAQDDTLAIGAAVTAAVIGIISFFIGGLVAARTAAVDGRGAGALNGFLVWALGVVFILALAAMGLGAVLGAAGDVVGATGLPNVNPPNVSGNQAATVGRNSALGAFLSLAIPALAAAIGGALGVRTDLAYEDAA